MVGNNVAARRQEVPDRRKSYPLLTRHVCLSTIPSSALHTDPQGPDNADANGERNVFGRCRVARQARVKHGQREA